MTLQDSLDNLQIAIQSLRDANDTLEGSITDLENTYSAIITHLKLKIAGLTGATGIIEAKVNELKQKLQNLPAPLDAAGIIAKLNTLLNFIINLQVTLSAAIAKLRSSTPGLPNRRNKLPLCVAELLGQLGPFTL
jgi:chromosome segregation ATPase